jgi:putative addiction module component (TIGR02574 family)
MLSKADLLKLDVAQRLALIEEIWETIAADPNAQLPISDEEKAMLDARLEEHDADPSAAKSWSDVRAELTGRK